MTSLDTAAAQALAALPHGVTVDRAAFVNAVRELYKSLSGHGTEVAITFAAGSGVLKLVLDTETVTATVADMLDGDIKQEHNVAPFNSVAFADELEAAVDYDADLAV